MGLQNYIDTDLNILQLGGHGIFIKEWNDLINLATSIETIALDKNNIKMNKAQTISYETHNLEGKLK